MVEMVSWDQQNCQNCEQLLDPPKLCSIESVVLDWFWKYSLFSVPYLFDKCCTVGNSVNWCKLVWVGVLADGELGRRLHRRLSGSVDGQVVRRRRWTELPRRFEPSRHSTAKSLRTVTVVLNRSLRRPHPPASFWGPASSLKARTVVAVPGRSSSVPMQSVTRPRRRTAAALLATYGCPIPSPRWRYLCSFRARCRELRRLSRCLPTTARGRHIHALV